LGDQGMSNRLQLLQLGPVGEDDRTEGLPIDLAVDHDLGPTTSYRRPGRTGQDVVTYHVGVDRGVSGGSRQARDGALTGANSTWPNRPGRRARLDSLGPRGQFRIGCR